MILDQFSLKGRVGIVTGAGQGLGKSFALALAEAGADVVVAELDGDTGQQTSSEITAMGRYSAFIRTNVTNRQDTQYMADLTYDIFGRLDFIINNAGIVHWESAETVSQKNWQKVMDVNITGVFNCCQSVAKYMIHQQSGSIINIASMSGDIVNFPQPQASYNASKAAVAHLTKSLAAEWAPHNIRVNAISPGYMKTAMTESVLEDPEYGHKWINAIPMKRPGIPSELCPAAIYLASDASSYMTGANLVIDGGYTIL